MVPVLNERSNATHTMNTDKFTYYESVQEFVSILSGPMPGRGEASEWNGNLSWEEARDKALKGSIEDAARIEPLIERFLHAVDIPTPGRARVRDVCGGLPVVPEFLSGNPEHFSDLRMIESESAPVRVWFDPTSSAVVSAESLLERGAAVAAFVLALSTTRPVELWIATSNQGRTTPCIKLGASPFVTSEVAFAVGHVAFARSLTYGWSSQFWRWSGLWAAWFRPSDPDQSLREALKAAPEDIVLGPAYRGHKSITDPEGWIRDTLHSFVC